MAPDKGISVGTMGKLVICILREAQPRCPSFSTSYVPTIQVGECEHVLSLTVAVKSSFSDVIGTVDMAVISHHLPYPKAESPLDGVDDSMEVSRWRSSTKSDKAASYRAEGNAEGITPGKSGYLEATILERHWQ